MIATFLSPLHLSRLFANPFSGYLTVVATLLFVTGFVILKRRATLKLTGERTEGEIVGHKLRMIMRLGQKASYMPIVRFPHRGSAVEFQSMTGANPAVLPIGARVQVIYLPSNPTCAEIDEGLRLWIAPASVLGLGAAALYTALHAAR